jgi:phage recombination protein Bet
MPDTNLAVMPQQSGVVVSREWESQLDLIASTVAPGLNRDEFHLFLHVCRVRHLDPLQRQVHAVKRRTWNKTLNDGKGGYEEKMTIQTGIDGYRAIANRTGLYMPSDREAKIEDPGKETLRATVYVKKFHPISGQWHEFSATAYYREFVQTYKSGDKQVANSMWEKMPLNQLTKCAEALALRKGWPEELGQIYSDEEMQHADSVQILPPEASPKQDKTQRDLGKMKPSSEPNRGHGQEGLSRQPEKTLCNECRTMDGHTDECTSNPKNAIKATKKLTSAERRANWDNYEGHDPKIHISFDEFLQMIAIEKELGLNTKDGDKLVKEMLDRDFEIQHRPLIRADQFQLVLDTIQKTFGPKEEAQEDPGPGEGGPLDGLFDK